ncbi:hypothetical protein HL658_31155 [Azospirillum sp. RWY-5-1]|uniref:Ner winged helix-turn-helix DNA-binding domain-containing protein n=1 Tax=Azospirillum oleiclasticum TaxID=2735135 RepID=A0ABX2TMF0_9PROT|nr:helix-turn-helix domain-containing protein [Azospirillum oleiclasticum]NYZ17023.1 hypothetical protein [Azospirillum oleiclasticum]NYZ24533.1 hypothetical protein [Azospirillum oleiclasticum]
MTSDWSEFCQLIDSAENRSLPKRKSVARNSDDDFPLADIADFGNVTLMKSDTSHSRPPKNADILPAWIVCQLWMRGTSLAAIADAEGVKKQTVSKAIADGRSARIERAVAKALGIAPHVLWPERFDPDGTRRPGPFNRKRPITPRIRRNPTTPPTSSNVKDQEAA